MSALTPNEWTEAKAQLACGCYCRAWVYVKDEDVTAEECLNRYAGHAWWEEGHTKEHAFLCLDLYPDRSEPVFWLDSVEKAFPLIGPEDVAGERQEA